MAQPAPRNFGASAALPVTLGPGARGVSVSELQAKMLKLGAKIQVTGEFDGATEQALRNFQKHVGLSPTGTFGVQEQQHLDAAMRQMLDGLGVHSPMNPGEHPSNLSQRVERQPQSTTLFQQLPTWQKGMMVLGILAVGAGILWLLGDKSGASVAAVSGHTSGKCPRVPSVAAFSQGVAP